MPFVAGQSGNPGGRPRESEAIKRLARKHAYRALEVLVTELDNEDAKVRLMAANAILDRGLGKPSQAIGGADDLPPIENRITEVKRTIVYPGNTDGGCVRPLAAVG